MSTRNKLKVNAPTCAESPSTSSTLPAYLIQLLDKKFNEQQIAFSERLKESESNILQRFSSLEAELNNMRAELKSLNGKINMTNKRCESLEFELAQAKSTICSLQNEAIASDVIISNIPNEVKADDAFNKIVSALQIEQLQIHKVFRTQSTTTAKTCVPIIVKLKSAAERVRLFRALAERRKKLKRQFILSDFGFTGDCNLLVHECLSDLNREIMRSALHFKRSKLLNSVFSLRGNVYIRVRPNDVAVKITSVDALNRTVGAFDKNICST